MDDISRILIVDDDESICRTMKLILAKQGYETETAGTGKEALEKASECFFNLAILDIKLPDMTGVDLLAPLKELHPDISLIVATAYADTRTAVQALNEGVSVYVTKPLNIDAVLAQIDGLIERQRLIRDKQRAEEALEQHREQLEEMVEERTEELRKIINSMAGREIRMAELKEVIRQLRQQLIDAGLTPVANDPLLDV